MIYQFIKSERALNRVGRNIDLCFNPELKFCFIVVHTLKGLTIASYLSIINKYSRAKVVLVKIKNRNKQNSDFIVKDYS